MRVNSLLRAGTTSKEEGSKDDDEVMCGIRRRRRELATRMVASMCLGELCPEAALLLDHDGGKFIERAVCAVAVHVSDESWATIDSEWVMLGAMHLLVVELAVSLAGQIASDPEERKDVEPSWKVKNQMVVDVVRNSVGSGAVFDSKLAEAKKAALALVMHPMVWDTICAVASKLRSQAALWAEEVVDDNDLQFTPGVPAVWPDGTCPAKELGLWLGPPALTPRRVKRTGTEKCAEMPDGSGTPEETDDIDVKVYVFSDPPVPIEKETLEAEPLVERLKRQGIHAN